MQTTFNTSKDEMDAMNSRYRGKVSVIDVESKNFDNPENGEICEVDLDDFSSIKTIELKHVDIASPGQAR